MNELHDEYLPKSPIRAADLSNTVPRILLPRKQQAAVSKRTRVYRVFEVLKVRCRVRIKASMVIQNDRFSSPGYIPVFLRTEVEDMRPQLALGIAVGGHRTAIRGVMQVKIEREGGGLEETLYESPIGPSFQLGNKLFPRRGNRRIRTPFKRIAVMTLLTILALGVKSAFEKRDIGERLLQTLVPFVGQKTLRIDPRVRLLRLEHLRINLVEPLDIEISQC